MDPEGKHNEVIRFDEAGLLLFRKIDAYNWKLAHLVQYVNDQLAAELRQCQRMMAIACVLVLGIWIMKDKLPIGESSDVAKPTAATFLVPLEIVRAGVLLQALIYASNAIGFHGYDEGSMPRLVVSDDNGVDPMLMCRIIAPAFVSLVETNACDG